MTSCVSLFPTKSVKSNKKWYFPFSLVLIQYANTFLIMSVENLTIISNFFYRIKNTVLLIINMDISHIAFVIILTEHAVDLAICHLGDKLLNG